MQGSLRGSLAVMVVGCALVAAAFSSPVQGRDRDRDDTRRYQQYDRNHDRDHNRGRHNGYAYGQYYRNYRGNGYYRRNAAQPFAYIGAANQQRYGYAGRYRRHHRHRRHH